MNYLVQIREKIKKAERLHQAQLLSLKKGEFLNYRKSVYEARVREIQKEIDQQDF